MKLSKTRLVFYVMRARIFSLIEALIMSVGTVDTPGFGGTFPHSSILLNRHLPDRSRERFGPCPSEKGGYSTNTFDNLLRRNVFRVPAAVRAWAVSDQDLVGRRSKRSFRVSNCFSFLFQTV